MAWEVAFLTSSRRWWYCLSRDKTIYKFYKWMCEFQAWEHSSTGKHSTHPDYSAALLFSKYSRLLYSFSRNAKVYSGDCWSLHQHMGPPGGASPQVLLSHTSQVCECYCCCSVAKSSLTLCHPMDAAHQVSLSPTISCGLSKFMCTKFMMLFNHLILCLFSCPAFNLSQHRGLFQLVSSSHWVAKVLELQLQYHSFQWIFIDFP